MITRLDTCIWVEEKAFGNKRDEEREERWLMIRWLGMSVWIAFLGSKFSCRDLICFCYFSFSNTYLYFSSLLVETLLFLTQKYKYIQMEYRASFNPLNCSQLQNHFGCDLSIRIVHDHEDLGSQHTLRQHEQGALISARTSQSR